MKNGPLTDTDARYKAQGTVRG